MEKFFGALTIALLLIIGFAPNAGGPSIPQAIEQHKEKLSVRQQHREKFESSRSRVTKTKIVKRYAFWYVTTKKDYTPNEWMKLHWIWTQESHWNWDAIGDKTSSGRAKGIPQVKWSKMIKDPLRQIEKGVEYIQHAYATQRDPKGINNAYKHWQKHRWY